MYGLNSKSERSLRIGAQNPKPLRGGKTLPDSVQRGTLRRSSVSLLRRVEERMKR
jgi:hypothetical protein